MIKQRRVKLGDVVHVRVKHKAVARCDYLESVEGAPDDANTSRCSWTFVPHQWETDADCRRAAREHVRSKPTHEVIVEVRDLTSYYLANSALAELWSSQDQVASGDDQTGKQEESQED